MQFCFKCRFVSRLALQNCYTNFWPTPSTDILHRKGLHVIKYQNILFRDIAKSSTLQPLHERYVLMCSSLVTSQWWCREIKKKGEIEQSALYKRTHPINLFSFALQSIILWKQIRETAMFFVHRRCLFSGHPMVGKFWESWPSRKQIPMWAALTTPWPRV